MALIHTSSYTPAIAFKSKHFNTIYRTLFHDISIDFQRERMETTDGDFMDIDFSRIGSKKLVVVIHGLEGSSSSKYALAMSQISNELGYDVAAVNLRGCSGETNRLLSSYHSGKTTDLAEILKYLEDQENYESFHLVGYSLGGNLVLKYMGESRDDYSSR